MYKYIVEQSASWASIDPGNEKKTLCNPAGVYIYTPAE